MILPSSAIFSQAPSTCSPSAATRPAEYWRGHSAYPTASPTPTPPPIYSFLRLMRPSVLLLMRVCPHPSRYLSGLSVIYPCRNPLCNGCIGFGLSGHRPMRAARPRRWPHEWQYRAVYGPKTAGPALWLRLPHRPNQTDANIAAIGADIARHIFHQPDDRHFCRIKKADRARSIDQRQILRCRDDDRANRLMLLDHRKLDIARARRQVYNQSRASPNARRLAAKAHCPPSARAMRLLAPASQAAPLRGTAHCLRLLPGSVFCPRRRVFCLPYRAIAAVMARKYRHRQGRPCAPPAPWQPRYWCKRGFANAALAAGHGDKPRRDPLCRLHYAHPLDTIKRSQFCLDIGGKRIALQRSNSDTSSIKEISPCFTFTPSARAPAMEAKISCTSFSLTIKVRIESVLPD